jgi:hypothetical protein
MNRIFLSIPLMRKQVPNFIIMIKNQAQQINMLITISHFFKTRKYHYMTNQQGHPKCLKRATTAIPYIVNQQIIELNIKSKLLHTVATLD